LRALPPEKLDFKGLLEVVVLDDGVGIAARHSLENETCDGPIDIEREIVRMSLQPGESVKLRAGDSVVRGDPGFGSLRAFSSLKDRFAFCALRSGRTMAVLDATEPQPQFRLLDEDLSPLPGTVFQAIIPRARRDLWTASS
jgi:hypothetical protein